METAKGAVVIVGATYGRGRVVMLVFMRSISCVTEVIVGPFIYDGTDATQDCGSDLRVFLIEPCKEKSPGEATGMCLGDILVICFKRNADISTNQIEVGQSNKLNEHSQDLDILDCYVDETRRSNAA